MERIEEKLQETLTHIQRTLSTDLQCANYWLMEHLEEIKRQEPEMSFDYLEYCSVRYEHYREKLSSLALRK